MWQFDAPLKVFSISAGFDMPELLDKTRAKELFSFMSRIAKEDAGATQSVAMKRRRLKSAYV